MLDNVRGDCFYECEAIQKPDNEAACDADILHSLVHRFSSSYMQKVALSMHV